MRRQRIDPRRTCLALGAWAFVLALAAAPAGLRLAHVVDNRVLRFSPVKSPTTTILTRKAVTLSSSVVVKGTTTGQVTRVRYRVGNSGPIRRAVGTSQWTFRATLKPGKNLITVIAEGPGGTSSPKSVLVIRN